MIEVSHSLSQFLHSVAGIVFKNIQQPLIFRFPSIYYSLVILPFDAVEFELLKASVNKL